MREAAGRVGAVLAVAAGCRRWRWGIRGPAVSAARRERRPAGVRL